MKIKKSGDELDFGSLNITFRIDNDMSNYETILEWIYDLRDPCDGTSVERVAPATLMLFMPNGKPLREIDFFNMFPVSIGDITFATNNEDTEYAEVEVGFMFDYFLMKEKSE